VVAPWATGEGCGGPAPDVEELWEGVLAVVTEFTIDLPVLAAEASKS
jgi:hypothetical protein